MTFQELIEICQDLKISASLIGGAVKMPPRLSLDIYQAVRTHKMAVIEYLEDIRSRRTPEMPQEAPVLANVGSATEAPPAFQPAPLMATIRAMEADRAEHFGLFDPKDFNVGMDGWSEAEMEEHLRRLKINRPKAKRPATGLRLRHAKNWLDFETTDQESPRTPPSAAYFLIDWLSPIKRSEFEKKGGLPWADWSQLVDTLSRGRR